MPRPPDKDSKIPCTTPQALQAELDTLQTALDWGEGEHTWEKVDKAIVRFTAVVKGGGYKQANFVEGVGKHQAGLQLVGYMLSDKGKLSGTTIDLLTSFAPRLNTSFAPLVSLYLDPIIKLLGRPNKVFIRRAEHCLGEIIANCPIISIANELRKGLQDASPTCRRGCAVAFGKAIEKWDKDVWGERGVKWLEEAIRSMGGDKDAEVRGTGKVVMALFASHWPERVDDFAAPLSPTIKRRLDIKSDGTAGKGKAPVKMSMAPPAVPHRTAPAVAPPLAASSSSTASTHPSSSMGAPVRNAHTRTKSTTQARPIEAPTRRPPPATSAPASPTKDKEQQPVLSRSHTARPEHLHSAHNLGQPSRAMLPLQRPSPEKEKDVWSKPHRPHFPTSQSVANIEDALSGPVRRFPPPSRGFRPPPPEEDLFNPSMAGPSVLRGPVRLPAPERAPPRLGPARRVVTAPHLHNAQSSGQQTHLNPLAHPQRPVMPPSAVSHNDLAGALKSTRSVKKRVEELEEEIRTNSPAGSPLPPRPNSAMGLNTPPGSLILGQRRIPIETLANGHGRPKAPAMDSPLLPVLARSTDGRRQVQNEVNRNEDLRRVSGVQDLADTTMSDVTVVPEPQTVPGTSDAKAPSEVQHVIEEEIVVENDEHVEEEDEIVVEEEEIVVEGEEITPEHSEQDEENEEEEEEEEIEWKPEDRAIFAMAQPRNDAEDYFNHAAGIEVDHENHEEEPAPVEPVYTGATALSVAESATATEQDDAEPSAPAVVADDQEDHEADAVEDVHEDLEEHHETAKVIPLPESPVHTARPLPEEEPEPTVAAPPIVPPPAPYPKEAPPRPRVVSRLGATNQVSTAATAARKAALPRKPALPPIARRPANDRKPFKPTTGASKITTKPPLPSAPAAKPRVVSDDRARSTVAQKPALPPNVPRPAAARVVSNKAAAPSIAKTAPLGVNAKGSTAPAVMARSVSTTSSNPTRETTKPPVPRAAAITKKPEPKVKPTVSSASTTAGPSRTAPKVLNSVSTTTAAGSGATAPAKIRRKAPLPSFKPVKGKDKAAPISASATAARGAINPGLKVSTTRANAVRTKPESIPLPLSPGEKAKMAPKDIPLPRSPVRKAKAIEEPEVTELDEEVDGGKEQHEETEEEERLEIGRAVPASGAEDQLVEHDEVVDQEQSERRVVSHDIDTPAVGTATSEVQPGGTQAQTQPINMLRSPTTTFQPSSLRSSPSMPSPLAVSLPRTVSPVLTVALQESPPATPAAGPTTAHRRASSSARRSASHDGANRPTYASESFMSPLQADGSKLVDVPSPDDMPSPFLRKPPRPAGTLWGGYSQSGSSRFTTKRTEEGQPDGELEEGEDDLDGITTTIGQGQAYKSIVRKPGAAQSTPRKDQEGGEGGKDLMEFSASSRPAHGERKDVSTPGKGSTEVLLAKLALAGKSTAQVERVPLALRDGNAGAVGDGEDDE